MPLDLDGYRRLVHLDEPFKAPDPVLEKESDRTALVDDLLAHFGSEATVFPSVKELAAIPSTYEEKRRLLQALLTVREPAPLPSRVHRQLDRLLQHDSLARGRTEASNLPRIREAFPGSPYEAGSQCALWRGDITTLHIDAIVNAANARMLGCFQPFHACIDNAIHSAAGPRLREDCHTIMRRQGCAEGTGWAKVTRAYNLPASHILHTVGPILSGHEKEVAAEQEQQLSDCYTSCLDLAHRVTAIRSIAFCCISTGVFGFPQGAAARIALDTVAGWLSANPDSLDLVLFNVYGEDDFEIYERLLKTA